MGWTHLINSTPLLTQGQFLYFAKAVRHGRNLHGADIRYVFQELPEPNRACPVGVYAFLIWNNLCDLVYQTPTGHALLGSGSS